MVASPHFYTAKMWWGGGGDGVSEEVCWSAGGVAGSLLGVWGEVSRDKGEVWGV